MQYVYVEPDSGTNHETYMNSEKNDSFSAINVKLSKNALVSLIKAFEPTEFGLDTLPRTMKQIKSYRDKIINPNKAKLYLDSGGYSYIKGGIHPYDTAKMIGCYVAFLEHYNDTFDYIFSLDIPFNTKYQKYNEYKFLKQMNYKSLKETVDVIRKNPEIAEKFFFVHQFKIKEQYEIWSELYNDPSLELYKMPIHRAIGGLVSITKRNKLSFNASIGIAYKCFFDYLNFMEKYSTDKKHQFKLHFLGINRPIDRFITALLEKLFTRYLEHIGLPEAIVSYDSINYCIEAIQKPQNLKIMEQKGEELIRYHSSLEVPEKTLKKIYGEKNMNIAKENIKFIRKTQRIQNPFSMIPLNIYSHLEMDKFMEKTIENYKLVDIFDTGDTGKITNELVKFRSAFQASSFKHYVPANFFSNLRTNLNIVMVLNDWYKTNKTSDKLEEIMGRYIEALKTPDKITKE